MVAAPVATFKGAIQCLANNNSIIYIAVTISTLSLFCKLIEIICVELYSLLQSF